MIDMVVQEAEEVHIIATELEWVEYKCPLWLSDSCNIHEIQVFLCALLSVCVRVWLYVRMWARVWDGQVWANVCTWMYLFMWVHVSVHVYVCVCHFDSHPHEYADQF